jgi:DNA-binding transcriptional LysR family regulator
MPLAPLIAQYRQRFPDVLIDLVLAQRVPVMIEEGFDVSVVVACELQIPHWSRD